MQPAAHINALANFASGLRYVDLTQDVAERVRWILADCVGCIVAGNRMAEVVAFALAEHGGEDIHHLTIAVVGPGELAPDPLECCRQHPVLERGAVAQRAGLAGQDRDVSAVSNCETVLGA